MPHGTDGPGRRRRADYKAHQAARPPAIAWHSGDGEIQSRVPDWSGKPVWGHERTTWIKYVAPVAGTWKPPAQAQATPAARGGERPLVAELR